MASIEAMTAFLRSSGSGPESNLSDAMQLVVVEAGKVEEQLDLVEDFRGVHHCL